MVTHICRRGARVLPERTAELADQVALSLSRFAREIAQASVRLVGTAKARECVLALELVRGGELHSRAAGPTWNEAVSSAVRRLERMLQRELSRRRNRRGLSASGEPT